MFTIKGWRVAQVSIGLLMLLSSCSKSASSTPIPTLTATEPVEFTSPPDGVYEPSVESSLEESSAEITATPTTSNGPYPAAAAPTAYPGLSPIEAATTYPGAFPTFDYNPYPDGIPTEGYNPYPGVPTAGSVPYPGITPSPVTRPQITSTPGVESTEAPAPTEVPEDTPTPRPTRDLNAELRATDPKTVQLASGKVQLVEFFAFWDGASKFMLPMLRGLETGYGSRINFIYLDIDDPANKRFKDQLRYRLQPHFFLLDEKGNILKQWQGYVEEADLINAFEAALR